MRLRRLIIAMVLVLVLAAGILMGLYYTGRIWAQEKDGEPPVGIYSLGEFVTNLSGEGGRRFIRVRVDVEVAGYGAKRELELKHSLIRNGVLSVLRACHHEEVEDDVGMALLAGRLREGINDILDTANVERVLFVELVVQ